MWLLMAIIKIIFLCFIRWNENMIIKIRFVFLLEMDFKINCIYYYLFRVFNSNCLDYILSSPSLVWQYRLWSFDSRPLFTIILCQKCQFQDSRFQSTYRMSPNSCERYLYTMGTHLNIWTYRKPYSNTRLRLLQLIFSSSSTVDVSKNERFF